MSHDLAISPPEDALCACEEAEHEANRVVELRTDTLSDSVMILLALTIVQRVVGFGRGVIFCRWLDADELGRWDMALGFLLLAAPLAVLGLPGSFGRYVEHYRQQGFLRTFLARTSAATALLACLAVGAIIVANSYMARLVFGDSADSGLMICVALTLGAVIVYNSLNMLFTAMRMYRIVSIMQFATSVGFAAFGIALLAGWRMKAESAVAAYGLSYAVVSVGSIYWLRRLWRGLPNDGGRLEHRRLWSKLMPFALWLWVVNWLSNTFDVADRYMLLHFSGLSASAALDQIGQYHSSRILPILFFGLAELFAAMITPHLSDDWERGDRASVVRRLNMFVKLFGFGITLASLAAVILAPALFGLAFGDKFTAALTILPLTLASCSWMCISRVTENFLWCAEKAWMASAGLVVALAANIGFNAVLIPTYGLWGAVVGTAIANLLYLVFTYFAAARVGMRWDAGAIGACALPVLLVINVWAAVAGLAAVFIAAVTGNRWVHAHEKEHLISEAQRYASVVVGLWNRKPRATEY